MSRLRDARVEDAPAIARIQVDGWRAAYPGMMPQAILDSLDLAEATGRWTGRFAEALPDRAMLVGEIDGQVAGFIIVGPATTPELGWPGEVLVLYVDPPHWRSGLGGELLRAGLARLARPALVWTLAANRRARDFYEKHGGVFIGHKTRQKGEAALDDVGYGFSRR